MIQSIRGDTSDSLAPLQLPNIQESFSVLQSRIQKAITSNLKSTLNQNEILDLKTEICSLKNKLLQVEQRRIEEANAKNLKLSQLEQKLNDQQRRQIEEMDEKEKKIEELEKDIESTIEA